LSTTPVVETLSNGVRVRMASYPTGMDCAFGDMYLIGVFTSPTATTGSLAGSSWGWNDSACESWGYWGPSGEYSLQTLANTQLIDPGTTYWVRVYLQDDYDREIWSSAVEFTTLTVAG
jgi:hypothetical protein